MNHLLKMSFDKYGYTYDFLTSIHKSKYDGEYLFQDEDKLILALKDIHDKKQKLVVIPDFDIDGISSGNIFYGGLSLLGFDVELYMPDVNNGYGFDCDDIDKILSLWPDTHAILTCDVGITCNDAIVYAQSKELWVYVTDHHIEKKRSTADAIVDPSRLDSTSDFIGVCGAYMAYHVMTLYACMTGNVAIKSLMSHLVLFASLGSCGDLMPVIHDTRKVIVDGLAEFNRLLDCETMDEYFMCSADQLPDAYVAAFENLRRFHFWLLRHGYMHPGDVTDVDYGFTYCPIFNSVKRMGESLQNVYDFFHTRYEWNDETFDDLAQWFWDLNKERKELVTYEFQRLLEDENQLFAPYVYVSKARPGILGLLAMKLTGVTGLPCMVVQEYENVYSGSGRTPSWFSGALLGFDGVTVDGHEHAFGISIDRSKCMDYVNYLKQTSEAELARLESEASVGEGVLDPRLIVCVDGHISYGDYDFSINDVNDYDVCVDYTYEIAKMRPFGNGFPEPEFLLKFTKKDIESYRLMGLDQSHLRICLSHNIKIVMFGMAGYEKAFDTNAEDYVYTVSGKFSMNDFNGSTSLQFMVSEAIC